MHDLNKDQNEYSMGYSNLCLLDYLFTYWKLYYHIIPQFNVLDSTPYDIVGPFHEIPLKGK